MSLRLNIKKIIAPIFAPLYKGRGSILMFHRILPDDGKLRVHTKALEVTPEKLELIIEFFKNKNYDFIHIEQVPSYLERKKKRKFVVFTFDDGYKDNYEIAYPIFKKHMVPFTIYVTTDMPDYKMILWQYMLEDLMLKNSELIIELNGKMQSFEIGNHEQKELVYNELRRYLIDLPLEKKKDCIRAWFLEQEKDLTSRVKKESLNWEQIRELSDDPLVEIGGHTVSHPSLATLSKEQILQEAEEGCDRISDMTGKRPNHFAYPYGSKKEITQTEIDELGLSSIKTSVTTREANIMCGHGNYLHALPRICVGPSTTITDIELFTSGITPFLRNTWKRLITT